MNRKELLEFHNEICFEAKELMKSKNHDYAGEKGDKPFANFERCEAMGVCSTEQGFLVRVIDKISRLSTFTESNNLKVTGEGWRDSVVDIINYMVLFAAFIESKDDDTKLPEHIEQYLTETLNPAEDFAPCESE